ncbi:MAG: hypothetical protein LBV53_00020 [Mycoplasmataceae bacterium]|nr:hypothetical protein [Mycoplasmataceae bacterium]
MFDKNELMESYRTNPDGTGFIYYDEAQDLMVVQKWLAETPFETIYKKVLEIEQKKNIKNLAIHFRIGTSGGRGIKQIHPQLIDGDMYLMHNGICREFEVDNNASDTQWIAWWLKDKKFKLNELNNPINKKIYENIFNSNKLLIIEKDKFCFINEDLGNWDKGIWHSWKGDSLYGWDREKENNGQLSLFYETSKRQYEPNEEEKLSHLDNSERGVEELNDMSYDLFTNHDLELDSMINDNDRYLSTIGNSEVLDDETKKQLNFLIKENIENLTKVKEKNEEITNALDLLASDLEEERQR